jgi:hypothetical protein
MQSPSGIAAVLATSSQAFTSLPTLSRPLLTKEPGLDPAVDGWTWEPPDLSKGSPWYHQCIASLRKAVANLPDGDAHFVNGLDALTVHRQNYSEKGPKYLQILWWEFPPNIGRVCEKGVR